MNQSAAQTYIRRIQQLREEEASAVQRGRRLTLLRGLTCLPAIGLAVYSWWSHTPLGYWLAGVLFLVFVVVVGLHERLLETIAESEQRRIINQQQLDRYRRNLAEVPIPEVDVPRQHLAVARDLDLFGMNSLFQWICLAQTPLGLQTLRDWLLEATSAEVIADRQQAVRRLAAERQLREDLMLRSRLLLASGKGPANFLEWVESPGWLASRRRLRAIVTSLTLAMLLAIGTLLLTPAKLPAGVAIAVLLIAILLINLRFVPDIHDVFEIVASRHNDVAQYKAALSLLRDLPDEGICLQRIRGALGQDPDAPLRSLDDLARRVYFASARHSSLWGLFYLVFQWVGLIDFHILAVIERWQRRHAHDARQWFTALGELEALVSMAAIAHNHPEWAFPTVDSGQPSFHADALGHPLLIDNERVDNDVTIGPEGTFLMVSGSNMSGKSTLLRSVGVNVLLGRGGAPTCTASCQMPVLDVATSMRVGDSLAEGVSFYLAELQRLKQIVDDADRRVGSDEPRLLYLLDEILQGTNSAERHIAVVRVIRHLLDSRAIGAVSTHDLELAASPELAGACRPVHFREQFVETNGQSQMTFDYQMRHGVATTTNALKLLELVGLD